MKFEETLKVALDELRMQMLGVQVCSAFSRASSKMVFAASRMTQNPPSTDANKVGARARP